MFPLVYKLRITFGHVVIRNRPHSSNTRRSQSRELPDSSKETRS
jgi:hypothetical protein